MAAEALTQLAMQYLAEMDDEKALHVIAYMEKLNANDTDHKKRRLSDLKGKIQLADGYDYKSMRQ